MIHVFLVGFGGFVGAVSRYLCGLWLETVIENASVPYATLAVNLSGCFLIGFLNPVLNACGETNGELRALLAVGFLGGFTTFSTFSEQLLNLGKKGDFQSAFLYVSSSVVLGVLLVGLGHWLAHQLFTGNRN